MSKNKVIKDTMMSATGEARHSNASVGVTFSTLANVPKAKRMKILSESKAMIGGAKKCREIWNAIRAADFRNEGTMNETNMNLVFEKNKDNIYDLLRI